MRKDEHRTPNIERRTSNIERRTPNAEPKRTKRERWAVEAVIFASYVRRWAFDVGCSAFVFILSGVGGRCHALFMGTAGRRPQRSGEENAE